MFHEIPLKLYFMKYSDRKISQCILAFRELKRKDAAAQHFLWPLETLHGCVSSVLFSDKILENVKQVVQICHVRNVFLKEMFYCVRSSLEKNLDLFKFYSHSLGIIRRSLWLGISETHIFIKYTVTTLKVIFSAANLLALFYHKFILKNKNVKKENNIKNNAINFKIFYTVTY